jgi:HAD superfamily hydrolase (TIGR01509 family)
MKTEETDKVSSRAERSEAEGSALRYCGQTEKLSIQAVIFDLDGLMLDTEPLYREAWQLSVTRCGFHLSDTSYLRLIGLRDAEAEKLLVDEFGEAFPLTLFRGECRSRTAHLFASATIDKKPGLDEILAMLEMKRVPKAVATSSEWSTVSLLLRRCGLLERFDVVSTGDDVAAGKPCPDIFLLTANRLNVASSNCLVLEDAEPGVIAARCAGMKVFLIPDLKQPSESTKQLADGNFLSLHSVTQHLETYLGDALCNQA